MRWCGRCWWQSGSSSRSAQRVGLVADQGAVPQFAAAGAHPALHHRVRPRHLHAAEHGLDPGVREDRVQQAREPPARSRSRSRSRIRNRARHSACCRSITGFLAAYATPGRARVRGGARDPDAPAGVLDHREPAQPRPGRGRPSRREHRPAARRPASARTRPRADTAPGRRVDPALMQDLPERLEAAACTPEHSSATAAAARTRRPRRDKPLAAAPPITKPQRPPVTCAFLRSATPTPSNSATHQPPPARTRLPARAGPAGKGCLAHAWPDD
jgi:hypothetical protein